MMKNRETQGERLWGCKWSVIEDLGSRDHQPCCQLHCMAIAVKKSARLDTEKKIVANLEDDDDNLSVVYC